METLWLFIQEQLLGMQWLYEIIGFILKGIGVYSNPTFGGMLHFFIYDVIKICILLVLLIFLISYIQSYFPPERSRLIIAKFKGIWANVAGALLGTITPFCSCSSIPLFIGFTGAGLPIGVTFSFLISSPMVDLGSLILLMSIFGWKIAFAYVLVGLLIAIIGGKMIEKLKMEDQVADFITHAKHVKVASSTLTRKERIEYAKEQVMETLKKVFPYILVGVAIGALIHNIIPEQFIVKMLGENNIFAVPLATLVGIPMYADIFGAIPVAESLLLKGAGLGTVLSFMMAVTTLSLPSMIMLSKAIKKKLLIVFVVIVSVGIILVGYLFNTFAYLFV